MSYFSPNGPLAQLPHYEYRPQQQQMAHIVERTLAEGGVSLIEAGTGTGKSLAYLIPAAEFSLRTGQRVVISTNTINLQEQLIHKDIPWIKQTLFPDIKAVLVKGWQNYLCLYRYERFIHSSGDLFAEETEEHIVQLKQWIAQGGHDGSKTEMPFSIPDSIWSEVFAESDTCSRKQCPFYDHCYVFKARRQMEHANVLVVNHHLLFADISVRDILGWQSEAVLPPYDHVILDEAHHVEDAATERLGYRFSQLGWKQFASRLLRNNRNKKTSGHLPSIMQAIMNEHGEHSTRIAELVQTKAYEKIKEADQAAKQFFNQVDRWLATRGQAYDGSVVARLESDSFWDEHVKPHALLLSRIVQELSDVLYRIAETMRNLDGDHGALIQETEGLANRAAGYVQIVDWLATADQPEHVFWVEARRIRNRRPAYTLYSAPIQIGAKLREWLQNGVTSATFCSATLAVNRSFSYMLQRLGLDGEHNERSGHLNTVRTKALASPFRFDEQVTTFIPNDVAEPGQPHYVQNIASHLQDLLIATRGRAFVLFTSFSHLGQTAQLVRPALERIGLHVFVQGEQSRSMLLESFKQFEGAVLFGADSFWEGVDVQGEALSLVVIVRLPFDVPSLPIIEARTEHIRSQGKDPFQTYALPRTALKLKQGFGRLIRASTDRGAVVIYDRRVLTRSYGRRLLQSLPPAEVSVLPHAKMVPAVERRIFS